MTMTMTTRTAPTISNMWTRRRKLYWRRRCAYGSRIITGEVTQKEVTAVFVRETDHINYDVGRIYILYGHGITDQNNQPIKQNLVNSMLRHHPTSSPST